MATATVLASKGVVVRAAFPIVLCGMRPREAAMRSSCCCDLWEKKTRHPEPNDAALALSGWSAPGNFATTAALHPERTVAFIRYHSHLREAPLDVNALKQIPALFIAGGKEEVAGTDDAEALWKRGRSVDAPWTFAIEPGARTRVKRASSRVTS
jgi:hypothetical protein